MIYHNPIKKTSNTLSKYLIINVDDINHDESINQGVLRLLGKGVVKSGTIIVNRDILPSTYDIINNYPEVSFGLHFNLSRYSPISPLNQVSSLIINNRYFDFLSLNELFDRINSFIPSEIFQELTAQYNHFIHLFKRAPSHIDSHHYIHSISPVKEVLYEFCRCYDVPLRIPVNPLSANIKPKFDSGVISTDNLSYGFRNNTPSIFSLKNILSLVKCGWTEMICHVRYNSFNKNNQQSEFNILTSESTLQCFSDYNIMLCNYYDLISDKKTLCQI